MKRKLNKGVWKIIDKEEKNHGKKSISEKEREGLEFFRQYMEKLERMSPEERKEEDRKADALLEWMLPPGHMWHTADEEDGDDEE